jgi:hypothetical protein
VHKIATRVKGGGDILYQGHFFHHSSLTGHALVPDAGAVTEMSEGKMSCSISQTFSSSIATTLISKKKLLCRAEGGE